MNNEQNPEFEGIENILINTKYNILIDAAGGTGKTTFARKLQQKYGNKIFKLTAVTGVAANNIGGITISRACNLGIYNLETHEIEESAKEDEFLQEAQFMVIDEISMFTLRQLQQVDVAFKAAKNNYLEPFGGVKVLLMGDYCQLFPIKIENGQVYSEPSILEEELKEFKVIRKSLNTNYRIKDDFSMNILNGIRKLIYKNKMNYNFIQFINKILSSHDNVDGVNLYSNSKDVPLGEFYPDKYYYSEGKAPYVVLPLEWGRNYLVTKNIGKYYNGQIICLHEGDQFNYLVSEYETVKVPFVDDFGNTKYKTKQGGLIGEYIALMPLVSVTTRKIQGSTFSSGNLSKEFFNPYNKVLKTSEVGYLRTLYTALSRFETLKKVGVDNSFEKSIISKK